MALMKKKILLIASVERPDLYGYLEADKSNEYHFLCGEKKANVNRSLVSDFIQSLYFWEDYSTALNLLESIKPDLLVFFEIFDLYQSALIIVAKSLHIQTIFIDHGLRVDGASLPHFIEVVNQGAFKIKLKKVVALKTSFFKSRRFYYATLRFVGIKHWLSFIFFPLFTSLFSGEEAMHSLLTTIKKPPLFLLFCRNNFIVMNHYYHCQPSEIIYTGVPFFDYLYKSQMFEEHIIYLDQPMLEFQILGWTKSFHHKLAYGLYEFAKANNIFLHIKLHPTSDLSLWRSYNFDQTVVRIYQNELVKDLYSNAKLVLSYSSTLLIGLLSAQKNVVLLGWNPTPAVYGTDFSKMNICHLSLDINDLKSNLSHWLNHNLCIINKEAYQRFLLEFNYPFDGLATARIISLINTQG